MPLLMSSSVRVAISGAVDLDIDAFRCLGLGPGGGLLDAGGLLGLLNFVDEVDD
jgi:hypothetical protein